MFVISRWTVKGSELTAVPGCADFHPTTLKDSQPDHLAQQSMRPRRGRPDSTRERTGDIAAPGRRLVAAFPPPPPPSVNKTVALRGPVESKVLIAKANARRIILVCPRLRFPAIC